MFKRKVQPLDDVLQLMLRDYGLETPLLQKRLVDAWAKVTGEIVDKYTQEKFIRNQTLHVKITNPSLRQDLAMMRTKIVSRLNAEVGAFIIKDVHIY